MEFLIHYIYFWFSSQTFQNKGVVNYHNKRSHSWPSSHRLYQKLVNKWYSPPSPCSVMHDVTHFITVWLCCRSNEGLSIFWSVRFLFVEPMLTVITDQEIYVCHQLRSYPLIRNRLHMLITMACFTGNGCQNICTLSDMVVTAVNNQSICIVY